MIYRPPTGNLPADCRSVCHRFYYGCSFALYCSYRLADSYGRVDDKQTEDPAHRIAAEIREFHSWFEEADEVYRRFRTCILADPPPAQYMPREWIPLSNH